MRFHKLIITGNEAHFKIPMRSKFQNTYKIPPISTVVGMLQNIYGKDINDFELGYFIEYEGVGKEIINIYKEVNSRQKTLTCSDRFTKDIIYVENLYKVRLVIYHNIEKEIEFKEPLTLGKANYLANVKFEEIDLTNKLGLGYNQYTPKDIGYGMLTRINTVTKYNELKGYYEYETELVRENLEEFELDDNYDETEDMNIYVWKWSDGVVS